MDRVVHFEIPYDKKERALKFYRDIFGWEYVDVPEMEYTLVHAAETDADNMVIDTGAINGGMFLRSGEAGHPVIVVGVRSVDETIKKVIAAGGRVVTPRQRIPNGSYARVADCEGNVIGLADSSQ